MWFDVQQALSEIEGATQPPFADQTLVQSAQFESACVADVASVATPPAPDLETKPAYQHPHGTTLDGRLLTWTGRVVSLDAWRMLTEWERNGSQGQLWNGITKQWEQPKGSDDG